MHAGKRSHRTSHRKRSARNLELGGGFKVWGFDAAGVPAAVKMQSVLGLSGGRRPKSDVSC